MNQRRPQARGDPPGKQSCPRHAHMAEEEIFVVVRGRGTLLDTLVTQ